MPYKPGFIRIRVNTNRNANPKDYIRVQHEIMIHICQYLRVFDAVSPSFDQC